MCYGGGGNLVSTFLFSWHDDDDDDLWLSPFKGWEVIILLFLFRQGGGFWQNTHWWTFENDWNVQHPLETVLLHICTSHWWGWGEVVLEISSTGIWKCSMVIPVATLCLRWLCIHHSAYTTVWGGGVRAGGLVIQYSILTCFVLFVFIVNNLVNVNIYFYSYPMIHTYIISVFFSTGIGFS